MRDLELKRKWLDRLRPGAVFGLFDYLPNTLYFSKDRELRLMEGTVLLSSAVDF